MANFTPLVGLTASPEFVDLLERSRCEVTALVERFAAAPLTPADTHAFENELANAGQEHGRRLLEFVYNRLEPATVEDCPTRMELDGEGYKRRPKTMNTIATRFGTIPLSRYLYEALEPGEPCIFPLERQLGIEAGLATPALAERIATHVSDQTQRDVLDLLKRDHGTSWSVDSLRKISASLSDALSPFRQEAQVDQVLELLKNAAESEGRHRPTLVVGRDGVMVPMRHKRKPFKEASTGTVSVMDRRGNRLGTVYLGQMPEPGQGTLSAQLTSLIIQVLKKWPGCPLRFVYVTDGGHHPQEYFKEVLEKMEDPQKPGRRLGWEWIVDFWHACGYLGKLREALFGEADEGRKWYQRMRHGLRHRKHGIIQVLRSATQLGNVAGELSPSREKLFAEAYNYLRKYARQMDYSRYRAQGKPIGSGVTEAACKTLFTQRLKQSGMRWEREGGQVIINLRVLKLSGILEKVFQRYLQSQPMPKTIASRRCKPFSEKILAKAA